ncbi:hypothetical protein [Streptomyces fradiae]|uniref:hypothetical protein n=1 Tax=Streptomyces fradiae TaxID=1906 RepID=UPI00365C822F
MSAAPKTATAGDTPGRPARPAGYWERIDRLVAQAPPLGDSQRAAIRAAFYASQQQEAA